MRLSTNYQHLGIPLARPILIGIIDETRTINSILFGYLFRDPLFILYFLISLIFLFLLIKITHSIHYKVLQSILYKIIHKLAGTLT